MNWRSWFAGRHAFAWAVAIGVLLALPSLSNGLFLDDYQQRIGLLRGDHANVFEFFHRGTPNGEAQMQQGVLPWWTHPATKVMFYRPLAQWLTALDYRLWPGNFMLMHLHSLLWYALTLLVACLTYRQLLSSRWSAALASLLFAVDTPHSAVAWLANRNIMPCLSSALLSLLCFRRRGWRWQLAGCALFAVSLSTGEAALAITGYYLGYALFLSDEPWHRRILRLLPYAATALAWLVFWKVRGFGTAGPGFYINPFETPGWFLHELMFRFPGYLVAQWFLPPSELFSSVQDSPLRGYFLLYALAIVALLVWLLRPVLSQDRRARCFALGMLIAVLPICTATPVQRSLWFVGFGAVALLALFMEQYRELPMSALRRRLSGIFAVTMMIVHLVLNPLLFVVYSKSSDYLDRAMDSIAVRLPDQGGAARQVLALSTFSYVADVTFPILKDQALSLGPAPTRSTPTIAHVRALTEAPGEYVLQRPSADSLLATCDAGFPTLRPPAFGFSAGDRVDLDDVQIIVRAVTSAGAPTAIEFDFSPGVLQTYEIIAWDRDHFVPAQLPHIGARVSVSTEAPMPTRPVDCASPASHPAHLK